MHSRAIAACVTAALLSSGLLSAVAARTPETPAGGRDVLALAARIDELAASVAALRGRVDSLEGELARTRAARNLAPVTAPFTVVNGAGTPIFTVSDQGYAAADRGRVHIGRGTGANYGIWFTTSSGGNAMSLGESKTGAGIVVLNKGATETAVLGEDGISLNTAANSEIVHLGPDPTNKSRARLALRGLLQITDENKRITVDAGTLGDGRGAVRTWPNKECKSYGTLRSPNCLMGEAP